MAAEPKVHVIERENKIKPGDVVRLVDKMTVEDRIALDKIAQLGPQAELDEKAALMQSIADEAKAKALTRRIYDRSPQIVPPMPIVAQPRHVVAMIALNVFVLCAVVAIAVLFYKSSRASLRPAPPFSVDASPKVGAARASEGGEAAPQSQKGRVGQ